MTGPIAHSPRPVVTAMRDDLLRWALGAGRWLQYLRRFRSASSTSRSAPVAAQPLLSPPLRFDRGENAARVPPPASPRIECCQFHSQGDGSSLPGIAPLLLASGNKCLKGPVAISSVGGNASACMRSPSRPRPVRAGCPHPLRPFQTFHLAVPSLTCQA
jgi:hypothetical protein